MSDEDVQRALQVLRRHGVCDELTLEGCHHVALAGGAPGLYFSEDASDKPVSIRPSAFSLVMPALISEIKTVSGGGIFTFSFNSNIERDVAMNKIRAAWVAAGKL